MTSTVSSAVSTQPSGAAGLFRDAREVLERARTAPAPDARLALAQVATVRTAGAVLALRDRPACGPRAARRRSVWEVLARRAPELGEWAAYLAVPVDLAGVGQAAGLGGRGGAAVPGTVSEAVPERVADDRVRDAERFLAAAERVVARGRRRTP